MMLDIFPNIHGLIDIKSNLKNVDIVVCPTFTSLAYIGDMLTSSNIALGAQNLFWEKKGAFTGEIAPECQLCQRMR